MAFVAVAISGLIAVLGALGAFAPEALLDIVRGFENPAGLYVAAGIRIVFGLALFFAAPTSRVPRTVRVVGVVIFVAGLITPLIGLERFTSLLEWWSSVGFGFIRTAAAANFAVGLLLAYAVFPRSRTT